MSAWQLALLNLQIEAMRKFDSCRKAPIYYGEARAFLIRVDREPCRRLLPGHVTFIEVSECGLLLKLKKK